MLNIWKFARGLLIKSKSGVEADELGILEVDSDTNKLNFHNGTSSSPVVTESHAATLSTKTINADNNTISNLEVDNLKTGVLKTDVTMASASDTEIPSALAIKTYVDNVASAQNEASEISFTPSGTIAATNVQSMGEELDSDIVAETSARTEADNTLQTNIDTEETARELADTTLQTNITNHIVSSTAHIAQNIYSYPNADYDAENVQDALYEVHTEVNTKVKGPPSATDNALVRYKGTTGKEVDFAPSAILTDTSDLIIGGDLIGASLTTTAVSIDAAGEISGATKLTVDSIVVDGNEISSVGTNLSLTSDGNGLTEIDNIYNQGLAIDVVTEDFTGGSDAQITATSDSIIVLAESTLVSLAEIVPYQSGQKIILNNKTGNDVTIVNNFASAYGILTGTGSDLTLADKASLHLYYYDGLDARWNVIGGTGAGTSGGGTTDVDILFQQTFESAVLADFTETGLVLDTTSPLHGAVSAKLIHDASVNQSFKEVVAVNPKFRGYDITLAFNISSDASDGNVTIAVYDETNAADIVASEQVTFEATSTRQTVSFTVPADCESLSYTFTALPEAGSPETFIDDVVAKISAYSLLETSVELSGDAETITIPLTQSGIIQDADTYIKLYGSNGYGSTNTTIPRFTTLQTSIGDGILYQDSATLGGSFTAVEDGVYSFSGQASTSASTTSMSVGLSLNSSALTTSIASQSPAETLSVVRDTVNTATTLTKIVPFSWTGKLNAGDVVRVHGDGQTYAALWVSATKQGSLKQVNVNSNSKITIPTSELRFEGASARGAVATGIVKFDTLAKIRGDAFVVTNTSADGTAITMTKAGKLWITTSLIMNQAQTLVLTKNQTDLTTFGTVSEKLASSSGSTTGGQGAYTASAPVDVVVGDVIRVAATANPGASSANSLNLSFQEQEIQVSVSNTLPQFSEDDSCVQVGTANGYGSTATTTRRFSNVTKNIGTDVEYTDSSTLGGQFVAKSDGIYHISYSESSGANTADMDVRIHVDGALVAYDNQRYNTSSTAGKFASASWSGYLTSGQIVTAVVFSAASNNGNTADFTISKVGKPNVTGVDVTPFVNVPQPETQSATLLLSASFGSAVITGALTSSEGTGIFSYDSTTGIYTALKKFNANLNYAGQASGAASAVPYISVRGVIVGIGSSPATANARATASFSGVINAGEEFYFGNGTSSTASFHYISVLATALSDQILTEPETFNTETAPLTYASSSQYTLSTLEDAPVGTFVTFTVTGVNSKTQTTTAPTQTTSSMNSDGIAIYPRAGGATSTAASPSYFAIQIGKGQKGWNLKGYTGAGRTGNNIRLDTSTPSTSTMSGFFDYTYDEATGILTLDAGTVLTSAFTIRSFWDSTANSSTVGYFFVNASKNPALTGMNVNRVACRYTSTAGGTIGTSSTLQTFGDLSFDTNGSWNGNTFTSPETGYYKVDIGLLSASVTLTTTSGIAIQLYKNGALYSQTSTRGNGAANSYPVQHADSVYLKKDDTLQVYANATVATTQNTTTGYNFVSIVKTGN